MTNEELNTALYQKMFAEQETFRDWLKSQPPEEILKHTYEYTVREDILLSLEYHDLTDAQTNALMKSPNPLGDVFHEFEQTETSYMDTVFDSMVRRADAVIQAEAEQRRILRETPLYPYPAGHAREHGELEQYCTSRKANIACKGAIEAAISEHYRDNRLGKEAALEVIDAFGMDRTLHVLAATVRHMDWDGRISRSNKEWAKTVPVFADMDAWGNDRNTELVVNSHPGLTDLFLSAARKEQHLRTPLCDEQIKAEAARLLSELQKLQEPNSPNRTHYMAQIAPDVLARGNSKDMDRLMAMLPFRSTTFSGLSGRKGQFVLISKEENRNQPLKRLRRSVKKDLQKAPVSAAKKSAPKRREPER